MQRLYSMFPGGSPGVGLIALRLCVFTGMAPLLGSAEASMPAPFAWAPLIAIAVSILAGVGTPVAGLVLAALDVVWLWRNPVHVCPGVVALTAALALACLGPGRWSIDATIFGRRVVRVPAEDGET